MQNQCKICFNSLSNETFVVREMMFGTREEFIYFKCSSCGCLQIVDPPKEPSKYYPSEKYYSYQRFGYNNSYRNRFKNIIKYCLFNTFLYRIYIYFCHIEWLTLLKQFKKTTSILDVGCGSGLLLREMKIWGYKNLVGIDDFIENDFSICSDSVNIFKQDIFTHAKKGNMYDLIMLHHSFEHMDNPYSVLEQLYKMLNNYGFLLIRIPVNDSLAFRKYGSNWVQLDAPRHFFYTLQKVYFF
jgi:SAM-dependent methyltransferase